MPASGDGPVTIEGTFIDTESDPVPSVRTLANIRQDLRADSNPNVRETAIVQYSQTCLDVAAHASRPDEAVKAALTAKGVDPSWLTPDTNDWQKEIGGAQRVFTSASLVKSFAADFPKVYQAKSELIPDPDITKGSSLSKQRLTDAKNATENMHTAFIRAAGVAFRLDQPVSSSAVAILDLHSEMPDLRQTLQDAKSWAQAEREAK